MPAALLFVIFVVLLVIAIPVSITLGIASVLPSVFDPSFTVGAKYLIRAMFGGLDSLPLLAVPMFVLSGIIMAKGGISKKLFDIFAFFLGNFTAGLPCAVIVTCLFYGAISGAAPATVAAVGSMTIPILSALGYDRTFSTAIVAVAGGLGVIIPPSIGLIQYGVAAEQSIGDLFKAGFLPGLFICGTIMAMAHHLAKKQGFVPAEKASWAERGKAFKDAILAILMPVIILGGIYGGIFTPTEAAAVSVVYGLFVGMVIYREVSIRDMFDILVDSAKTTGGIMLIVASASLFSFVCTKFGIADAASNLLGSIAHNQFTFLLIVNIIFLIAGCFIDANSAMYIFIPIMLPVCKALGYDIVAFGVMATVNLAIGQVTPPVGVNLFVAISIKIKKGLEVTLQEISRAVVPMIAACVAVLLIVTYIPITSTFLPKALAKEGSYTGDQSSASSDTASKDAGDGNNSFDTIADYSDLDWPEMTWNFACSTTETSTWADGGRKFGELMEKATGGKVKVNIYAADQLTNGNQSEGIQALMNGDPVQISMHSNLIYSAFDPRFNVVSLPFVYDSYEDADAKFDGEAGAKLKELLSEYGLHCMGIAENGFREITNSKHEIKSVDDMKNLKVRVAGSNLLMECYKRWGADATNMNWSETYTALQQNTVEGQENPLPAIDAASVQEVQPYCSMWDAIYDCLFFCINENIYNSLTPQQQEVVDEAGQKAVEYERYINRSGDDEIKERWASQNGVTITEKEDMDIDSFKKAVDGIDDWFVNELKSQGYDDAQDLVDLFTKDSFNTVEDYSDLDWPETTWNFACSTTETSTWADGGRKFGELMEKATGGKVKVNIYAADQLTNGNQSEGIQALMNGDPVQISMHSNLIYSAFDPRFNVVSLPFVYDSYDDADAKFDGEAGEKLKEILGEYGLHCMGIAENGFREITNSKHEIKSVDDMKNLKVRVAGSNLLMECYKRWGADATNMNWSETYTALQQNTVEGEENPLPAIDAASVQEVQPYCSMWDAIYDCLFFCINQDIYDGLTPEQQAVVDECGQKAVEYERYINRSSDNEIKERWESKNGVTFTEKADMDIDSFKEAVDGVDEWFVNELKSQGYEDGQDLVDLFTK